MKSYCDISVNKFNSYNNHLCPSLLSSSASLKNHRWFYMCDPYNEQAGIVEYNRKITLSIFSINSLFCGTGSSLILG